VTCDILIFKKNNFFPLKKQAQIQKYGSTFLTKCQVTLWLTPPSPLWHLVKMSCPLPQECHVLFEWP